MITASRQSGKTNAQKIFQSVACNDGAGNLQIRFYTKGVGTSGSKLGKIADGATGWDPMTIYSPDINVWCGTIPGDQIYLFGFSSRRLSPKVAGRLDWQPTCISIRVPLPSTLRTALTAAGY